MEPLNRVALLVRPKRRYKEWADAVADTDDDPVFDLDEARTTPAVYLVRADDGASLQDYIDEYAAEIFELELEAWCTDESQWPVNRTPHVFRDWFDVTSANMVVDLDPDEPLDIDFDDDDIEADPPNLLAALSGVPGATMACAWCEATIEPDDPVVTVNLKGERGSHAEAELIEFQVAGRTMQAVVPGDESDAARQGVMAFVMFCGDECADAFREAWARERGALSS